jgi:SAM-dependent methyltransferase
MELHRHFYERKARTYGTEDPLGAVRYRRALAIADLGPGHRVLDIGCKRCELLRQLRDPGPSIDYTGVDIAAQNVRACREAWPDHRFEVLDITHGAGFEDETFDRVFALEVMEHVPAPAAMLEEVRRLLAPGGRLLLSVPNPYFYSEILFEFLGVADTQGHLYAWGDANLRRLLEFTGFEVRGRVGTYLDLPHFLGRIRPGGRPFIVENVPAPIARSRVYDCRPMA